MIPNKLAAYKKSVAALGRLHWKGAPFLPKRFLPLAPFNREAYNDFLVEAVRWNFGKNPIIYDVGANNGDFAMAFSTVYPASTVTLFEPIPSHLRRLRGLQTDGSFQWIVQPFALGDRSATLEIEIPVGQEAASSLHGFSKAYLNSNPSAAAISLQTCEVRRLDDLEALSTQSRRIDLLKIDVEGFEFSVLEGASETLRNVNHMVVEVSRLRHSESRECPVARMVALAAQHEMSLFRMEPTILDDAEPSLPLEYDLYFCRAGTRLK